jgi:hypothetical protein
MFKSKFWGQNFFLLMLIKKCRCNWLFPDANTTLSCSEWESNMFWGKESHCPASKKKSKEKRRTKWWMLYTNWNNVKLQAIVNIWNLCIGVCYKMWNIYTIKFVLLVSSFLFDHFAQILKWSEISKIELVILCYIIFST